MNEELFLAARVAIGRSARKRNEDADPLLDRALANDALLVLAEARGVPVDGSTPFPATLWLGGATDTYAGRAFTGSIAQFVALLEQRAKVIAPKRTGWIVEPTTNPTGRRTNQATLALHALFLDADGTGEWNSLLANLKTLGFAFIAYQSGGWSAEMPKWRVVLPLTRPFDTSNEQKQTAWKMLYNHCRVVFGALAQLKGVGFDPATETPCSPWFLTERRDAADTTRQVIWQAGYSLDLTALCLALPDAPATEIYDDSEAIQPVVGEKMNDVRFRTLVQTLTIHTSAIPVGRRDLYLALTGALLDRGVSPTDTLAIVEAVSANYPRSHPEKHRDNVHNARTTIARWLAGERVTRIGTLNSVAPTLAHVLDMVLPSAAQQIAQATRAIIDARQAPTAPTPPVPVPVPPKPPAPTVKLRRGLSELGKEIANLCRNLKDRYAFEKTVLTQFVNGSPLPPEYQTAEVVGKAMFVLGLFIGKDTLWSEVLDFASMSLGALTLDVNAMASVERCFYEGRANLLKRLRKQALVTEAYTQARDAYFKDLK